MDAAVVVLPSDAEGDDAVGLGHAFEDVAFAVFRMFSGEGEDGFDDFVDGLVEFLFAGVAFFESCHEGFDFFIENWVLSHRLTSCTRMRGWEMKKC